VTVTSAASEAEPAPPASPDRSPAPPTAFAPSPAPPPAKPPLRVENVPLGIGLMVAATLVFAGASAISKWQVARYPMGELLFVRTFASFVFVALLILPRTGFGVFRTRRLKAHGLRSLSQFASQSMILIAFSMMPLASVIAITFSASLFAALASAVFLKEVVGLPRWTALGVGLAGVLIVTHPGSDTFQMGALFALGNAVLYGTVTAGVRGMTATESSETLTIYQTLMLSVMFAMLLPLGFVMPTPIDALAIVAAGVMNGIGQYWWTRALSLAPASAVAPFYYFMLVWALMFGFLIWGDVPTASLLAGAAIVVGSGLYLLWHESRRKPR
jgi:drug/metabolite transporter (DMT)-like permease